MNFTPSAITSFYRSQPRTLHIHLTVLVFLLLGIATRRFPAGHGGFYYAMTAFCAIAGGLHIWAYERWQAGKVPDRFWYRRLGFTLLIVLLGMLCFLLSRKISLPGNWWQLWKIRLPLAGSWEHLPAFLAFPAAWLARRAFELWWAIPRKRYKLWFFPYEREITYMEIKDPITVSLHVSKRLESKDYINKTIKAPQERTFGDVFQYFLTKYNTEKDFDNPIRFAGERYDDQPWGWLFHQKPTWYRWWKCYVDPALSVAQNGLREKSLVVAERVLAYEKDRAAEKEPVLPVQ